MKKFNRKDHWEKMYQTNEFEHVSWYQKVPSTSLGFLKKIKKSSKIIDIGGGDSFFVDHLIKLGFEHITVLDISESAIKRAKKRLGANANKVIWIVADAVNFSTEEKFDFWHDRALFHFFTEEKDINKYIETIQKNLNQTGVLVIGTFSEQGPKNCSGIEIKQYSETSLPNRMGKYFKKIKCIVVDHETPFDTLQNFIFCSFRRQ